MVMDVLKNMLVTFFVFVLFFGFSFVIWENYVDQIAALPNTTVSDRVETQIDDLSVVFNFMDSIVPFFFLALWGSVIFFAIRETPDHPFFYIISMASLLILTLFSIMLTDLGTLIFDQSIFTPIIDNISNSLFFVNNYHYISFGVMLISLTIYYSRNKAALERGIQ